MWRQKTGVLIPLNRVDRKKELKILPHGVETFLLSLGNSFSKDESDGFGGCAG